LYFQGVYTGDVCTKYSMDSPGEVLQEWNVVCVYTGRAGLPGHANRTCLYICNILAQDVGKGKELV